MKKSLAILAAVLLAAACSEPFDLKTRRAEKTYLVVEAVLTNIPSTQTIILSESVDFQSTGDTPYVSGAEVSVSDGEKTYTFTEREDQPGYYDSPKFFCTRGGLSYTLRIGRTLPDGTRKEYSAVEKAEEPGFDIDRVDYKYMGATADSTWALGVWGTDRPQTGYFLISTAVNGVFAPTWALLERAIFMPDTYFNGQSVSGFPIAFLYQTADQMKLYGDCAKPLEKGDMVSLVAYTMTRKHYDFVMALMSASGSGGGMLGGQPANLPTNISGGDAMGYFAVCPVIMGSCVVGDPFKTEFDR